MNLESCKNCEYHQQEKTDSVVCKYQHNISYFVIDNGTIVSCPREYFEKKKIS